MVVGVLSSVIVGAAVPCFSFVFGEIMSSANMYFGSDFREQLGNRFQEISYLWMYVTGMPRLCLSSLSAFDASSLFSICCATQSASSCWRVCSSAACSTWRRKWRTSIERTSSRH